MTRQFGLIGYPLGHSFSKGYFAEKFQREALSDCSYENYPIASIGELPALIRENGDLCGLNVTIPYKESVIPYLHDLHEEAEAVGAVNTIRINDGRLTGYNTDVHGFLKSLQPLLADRKSERRALVLGTGGASKAVVHALGQLDFRVQLVSRRHRGQIMSYDDLDEPLVRKCGLIVNTTPLGMHPDTDSLPDIPYDGIGGEHILFDLVYNPEVTRFLEEGRTRGAVVRNGLEMLQLQAEKAWAIWNDF